MFVPSLLLIASAAVSGPDEHANRLIIADAQVTVVAEVRVPAREAGVLSTLRIKEGDRVALGDVLGEIDAGLAELDEEFAKIEHEMARLKSENDVDIRYSSTAAKVAQRELDRAEASDKQYKKSVSATELDRKRLLVEQANLAKEQAIRDQKLAQFGRRLKGQLLLTTSKRVERRRIESPFDGVVVQLLRQRGEWLDPGEPLARVLQLDPLRVEAFVDGKRFGADLKGLPVSLEVHLPPGDRVAQFKGKIVFVSPELHPVNGQIRIYAEVANPDHQLRPGALGVLTVELK